MGAPSITTVLEACLKATLVLCLAGIVVSLRRRASAAARHLVWALGLASAVALPVLSTFVPAWDLPLLPAAAPAPVSHPLAMSSVPTAPPMLALPDRRPHTSPALYGNAPPPAPPAADAPGWPALALDRLPVSILLLLAWLAGVVVVVVPLLVGGARVWWLRRRSEPLASPVWSDLAREVARSLDLARPVQVLRGARQSMPMAWGLLKPAVLLPGDAEQWPDERRRAVLTHELAHVKRHDCLTQSLAHLACAIYWFHPLVWLAAHRLRAERERACDDLVLRAGASGPDYADHLLQVARGLRATRHPAWAAVAMARPSQLEGRFLAILDPSLDRRTPSRPAAAVTVALAVGLILPLAF